MEIQRLEASLVELENGSSGAMTDDIVSPELERLLAENSKLKYQISHLKRVLHTASLHCQQKCVKYLLQ